jgi:hypothetical protein
MKLEIDKRVIRKAVDFLVPLVVKANEEERMRRKALGK